MKLNRMSSIAAIVSLSIIFMAAVAPPSGPPATANASTTDDEARGRAWWAHVQYLAAPSMKGRQTGSEEFEKAAAAQFNDFLADLGRAVADDPGRPHYLDSSFFRRFENPR